MRLRGLLCSFLALLAGVLLVAGRVAPSLRRRRPTVVGLGAGRSLHACSFALLAEAYFRATGQPDGRPDLDPAGDHRFNTVLSAFEERHGKVAQCVFCDAARAAAVLTEGNRIYIVFPKHRPDHGVVRIEALLFQCQELSAKANSLLRGRERRVCVEMIFGVIAYLLGLLDVEPLQGAAVDAVPRLLGTPPQLVRVDAGTSRQDQSGVSARGPLSEALGLAEERFARASRYYRQAAEGTAHMHYFLGIVWGVLAILFGAGIAGLGFELKGSLNLPPTAFAAAEFIEKYGVLRPLCYLALAGFGVFVLSWILASAFVEREASSARAVGGWSALCGLALFLFGLTTLAMGVEFWGDPLTFATLLLTLISAALGAAVSAASRLGRGQLVLRRESRAWLLQLLGAFRPLVGAIIAVVLYILLMSDVVSLPLSGLNDRLAANRANRESGLYFFTGLAFIAGFSERFAQGILARVDADDQPAPVASVAQSPRGVTGRGRAGEQP